MKKALILLVLAAVAAITMTGCASTYQKGVDEGYAQRQSDETKRRYWKAQAKKPATHRTVYYTYDESGTTDAAGQVKPAGTKVSVPVAEPQPVK